MKIIREAIFRILFVLAALVCFDADAFSNDIIRHVSVALTTGSTGDADSFSSEIDAFDDDQMSQSDEIVSKPEDGPRFPTPRNRRLILKFFLSVWQPPEIS